MVFNIMVLLFIIREVYKILIAIVVGRLVGSVLKLLLDFAFHANQIFTCNTLELILMVLVIKNLGKVHFLSMLLLILFLNCQVFNRLMEAKETHMIIFLMH